MLTAMKAENWKRIKELLLDKESDIDVNSCDQVSMYIQFIDTKF